MINSYENGGEIFICGNGESASDSAHILGELMKGFKIKKEVNDNRIPIELRDKLQGAFPAIVPETETYLVQEYHLPVYHYLCAKTEEYFFGA